MPNYGSHHQGESAGWAVILSDGRGEALALVSVDRRRGHGDDTDSHDELHILKVSLAIK